MHLTNIALVLEGGGMRGMFSAGVFEAFLLKELTFPYHRRISRSLQYFIIYVEAAFAHAQNH